ncbi:hypothetical protein LSTR_LSTR015876 [Laodelphax striatellus]|uniref:Uncharacterized protein n=1 Tax=Laodelphax striatellus TaxID=195883 RepID=A0A482WPZ1_LAOST|nr:hypothetical protein LSTR_LSTR015876 [Laodelphax striatellus]
METEEVEVEITDDEGETVKSSKKHANESSSSSDLYSFAKTETLENGEDDDGEWFKGFDGVEKHRYHESSSETNNIDDPIKKEKEDFKTKIKQEVGAGGDGPSIKSESMPKKKVKLEKRLVTRTKTIIKSKPCYKAHRNWYTNDVFQPDSESSNQPEDFEIDQEELQQMQAEKAQKVEECEEVEKEKEPENEELTEEVECVDETKESPVVEESQTKTKSRRKRIKLDEYEDSRGFEEETIRETKRKRRVVRREIEQERRNLRSRKPSGCAQSGTATTKRMPVRVRQSKTIWWRRSPKRKSTLIAIGGMKNKKKERDKTITII